jgi:HTH-type transcriptional regulator/antitoxin HigA
LVEAYEEAHFHMDMPDPIEAIKFRLEQQGVDTKALIGIIAIEPGFMKFCAGTAPYRWP